MLTYTVTGPHKPDSRHLVVYATPGCTVPTCVCICRTAGQAEGEAGRLNAEQVAREQALQDEREMRDAWRISHDLNDVIQRN